MKSHIGRVIICSFIFLFLQSLVYALEDFEIIEDDPAITTSSSSSTSQESGFDFSSFWDKRGAGSLGAYTILGNNNKYLYFLNTGLNYEWSIMKFYIESSMLLSKAHYSDTSITRNKLLIRNAYVDFSLTDNLNLAIGRQTITFGQFDIFSPIDLVLPMEFDLAGGQGFSKHMNRRPQDTAKLSWFPSENLELSGYYFPNYENIFSDNSFFADNGGLEIPSASEAHQYALRVLYYHELATVGLSYYDGWNHFFPTQEKHLEETDVVSGKYKVRPNQMIGFEISKPMDTMIWKFEIAKSIQTAQLSEPVNNGSKVYTDYLAWIQNENKTSLVIEKDLYFYALGLDANLESWKLNIAAVFLQSSCSGKNKEGFDLSEKNRESLAEDNGVSDISFIPTILIRYYLNDDSQSHIGLGTGWLGGYSGAELYYAYEFMESLTVMIGYHRAHHFSDSQEDSQTSSDSDTIKIRLISGPRFGLLYKF